MSDICTRVRELGFECSPIRGGFELPLSLVVPNEEVRTFISYWAVFPANGAPYLVEHAVNGIVGNPREERKVVKRISTPGCTVRVPLTGRFVSND